jgi:prepilin-type processing-associated H-X9-DG protein
MNSKTPLPVDDLAEFLSGDWHLVRRLTSLEPRQGGAVEGRVSILPWNDGLDYCETVDVQYVGYRGRATREYRYRLSGRGSANVCFADGRFFHALDLRQGRWRAEHVCGRDIYRGSFRVLGPGRWVARWRVRGPRKDLCIMSLYERVP